MGVVSISYPHIPSIKSQQVLITPPHHANLTSPTPNNPLSTLANPPTPPPGAALLFPKALMPNFDTRFDRDHA